MGRAPGGGGMGRGQGGGATAFRFTSREVSEMEKALENSKGSTPARTVVHNLAENFTNSAERAGQKPIQWKQVWNWFQNRRHSQKAKIAKSPETVKPVSVAPEPQANKVVSPSVAGGPGRSRSDTQQMEFEAKSARDGAWYDVSTFISHRVAASGDPEVRVRFSGFGSEEDEWVNVRSAVRQRSLPCEASECVAVLPGDLILCFQEGNEQALYFDADILDVQRRRHDVRGCRCRFWVRYRHDQAEEVVPLRKVCRRPETEYRLLKLQSYGKSSVIPAGISQAGAKPDPALSLPGDGVVTDAASSAAPMLLEAAAPPSSAGEMLEPSAVMGEVAAPVQVAPDAPQSSSAVQLPDHNPGAGQIVEPSSERAQPQPVIEGPGATLPVQILSVQQTQAYGQEVPSLQAPPEIFNSESESIIVLDRSDIEGINRP